MEEKQGGSTKKEGMKLGALQAFAMGVVAILVLVAISALVYGVVSVKKVSDSGFSMQVAKTFNLSAAKINGLSVSYVDYIDDLQTLEKFYAEQADLPQPSEDEVSDQVISRLMANTLIANIAKDYDVEVLDDDVDEMKAQLLSQFPDEAAAEAELMTRYGWSLEKYIAKVIKPLLLEQNLQKVFEESTVDESDENAERQIKASHILFKLDSNTSKKDTEIAANEVLKQIKDGTDFAEMATKYGTDATKDVGGDLGWFSKGSMVPEFEEAVFALKPSELRDELVETQFGYHIVKVEDERYVQDFVTFMDQQIKSAEVKILINIHNPFESLIDLEDDEEDVESDELEEVEEDSEDTEEVTPQE